MMKNLITLAAPPGDLLFATTLVVGLLLGAPPATPANAQAGGQAATGIDATERRMGEYIDAHVEDAIDLLARLARIGSGTHNLEGVRRMGELLTPELEQLGFTVAPAAAVRLSDHSPRRAAAAIR